MSEIEMGEYEDFETCVASGKHLTRLDGDGYCRFCGNDDSGDDDSE